MAWEPGSRENEAVSALFPGPLAVLSQDLRSLAIMKPPHGEETKLHWEARGRRRTTFNPTLETCRDEPTPWTSALWNCMAINCYGFLTENSWRSTAKTSHCQTDMPSLLVRDTQGPRAQVTRYWSNFLYNHCVQNKTECHMNMLRPNKVYQSREN